jgi:hypothetical protein
MMGAKVMIWGVVGVFGDEMFCCGGGVGVR